MADGARSAFEAAAVEVDGSTLADAQLTARALRILLDALPYRMRFEGAAAALGVTSQELEAAFARQNLNPRDHLRRLRLRGLHADLEAGRPGEIGRAFARWGFPPRNHEVVRDYRRLFGCSPMETHRTARIPPPST